LALTFGSKVQPLATRRQSLVGEDDGTLVVNTGAARLEVDKKTGKGGLYEGDRLVSPLPVSRLTATDGTVYLGQVESVEIEDENPQRVVIKVTGHHVSETTRAGLKPGPSMGFVLRYYCYAGDPFVRVDHVLCHDIVSPDMEYGDEMKSFASLDLVFEPSGDAAVGTVAIEDGATTQLADGERLFQHFDDQYLIADTKGTQPGRRTEGGASAPPGKRAPGLMKRGALTVAVRDFWQNWPKSLEAQDGKLIVGLYPSIEPKDRYANRPDERILYYYLRDGNYTFRSGFEKRHELLMGPTDALEQAAVLARVNAPLLVTADPKWYTSSGALHNIAPDDPSEFAMYDEILDQAIDAYVEVRERNHWYGLMNYGDWYGERGNNWGNIEYDLQHGLLTQYFRTGDRRFFREAERAARHNADVDVVHYAAGQKAGPGNKREVGQAWVHCMGHTGGYYPYDHLGMTIYAQGYAENQGHMWNQGNLEYYLLTGDEQVHHSAMQLADWNAGPNTVNFGYGNARVPGWMGIIAMSTYFATYDEYYLNAMRLMYEEVQDKGDPKYGLWVHKLSGGHCHCDPPHYGEAGFMAGVLMTALKYYYEATGDEEVAQRIVKIANFIVDTMWEPREGGFRYTSCPKTHVTKTSAMIMANGLAFAANYSGDKRLVQVTQQAFTNGMIAFRGAAGGKSIGSPICSAPMAMYEISRFPGERFDQYYDELMRVAVDPARRPLPCNVPNPNFEENTAGWVVRSGLELTRSTEVAHSGQASAMAAGSPKAQNEYFVTRYACGPPWEIVWLEPGKQYRLQLWLRVDKIGEGIPAPSARIAMRSKGVTRTAFSTNEYDLKHLGQWQLLLTEFTVPEYYDAAYIAVSTHTREEQEVLMYMDDVAVVRAEVPARDTYVYASAIAADAKLTDSLTTTVVDGYAWEAITSAEGKAGAAEFTMRIDVEDDYRLLARLGPSAAKATLDVSIDGASAGTLVIEPAKAWRWVELTPAPDAAALRLEAGEHTVTIKYPAGQAPLLQKVCLTNELVPQAGP